MKNRNISKTHKLIKNIFKRLYLRVIASNNNIKTLTIKEISPVWQKRSIKKIIGMNINDLIFI